MGPLHSLLMVVRAVVGDGKLSWQQITTLTHANAWALGAVVLLV